MKKIVALIVLVCSAVVLQAQNQTAPVKIGYADTEYIFNQMPDAKRIDAELKSLQAKLKSQIEAKSQEFTKKLQDYNENVSTMIDAVRANTERELQMLQQNLEKLQQDAQTSLQTKQSQLMEPVYTAVGKAIEDVATENGFTLILNSRIGGLDVVLYGDEKINVSDLVLKKLGVTPTPAPANNKPTTQKQ